VLAIISLSVGYASIFGARVSRSAHAFSSPVTGLSLPGVGSSIPVSQESVLRASVMNRTLHGEQPVPTQQQQQAAVVASLSASPTPTPPPPDEGAAVRAANVAPPPDLPPFQIYTVKENDTVSKIAGDHNIDPDYITWNNAELEQNSDFLQLGQQIIIPAGNGILYQVRLNDTLSDIATRYNVDMSAITSFAPNHIAAADDIHERDLIYVPGGVPPAPPPVAEPTEAPSSEPEATPVPSDDGSGGGTGGGGSSSGGGGGIVGGGPSSGHGLIWPVVGPISSYYGPSHPLGIDIDGYNLAGAPIAAATSGTVIFAGGNPCCSYGYHVILMSPDGIETLYGHLSVISVSEGEQVAQGQQLGIIGNTGYSTGRHLHFEVIDNGVRENPLDYLP
jgi:murein DD-endopeptidase MepM/ murein hydrolase activator NlpD